MNVSFTSNSLTNSTVIDSATGQALYELSTPPGLRTTTTLQDKQGNVIGEYAQGFVHDEVTYLGRKMKVSDWLVKKSILSRARTFTAQDGRQYKWEYRGTWKEGYELLDCQTGRSIAKGHRKHSKLFSPSIKCNIDVTPDGLPILDAIVLSFVICELRARRDDDAAIAASTSSAAAVSG